MKILLITDYGHLAGGAELVVVRLRDELRRRGHDARIFSTDLAHEDAQNLADYTCLGTTSRFRTLLQTANPWAHRRLSVILRDFRPDVVHVRMFLTQLSPLILALLKDVPSVLHVAWYRTVCPRGTKTLPSGRPCNSPQGIACLQSGCLPLHDWVPLMIQGRLLQRWRDRFDLVVANSHAVRDTLEAEGLSQVKVVHNGIPVQPKPQSQLGTPTVVFAGRLVPEKGVLVALEAFRKTLRKVPDARFLIAGDGPQRRHLQESISALGIDQHVDLLGRLSQEETESAFRNAWVQIVPSVWPEPFGLVAVEAMMRGQAVIASDHGGLSEIVQHASTGLLVAPNESGCLARALTQVLSGREAAMRMGAAGYSRAAEHFGLKRMCDRFVGYYRQLTSSGRKTPWSTDL